MATTNSTAKSDKDSILVPNLDIDKVVNPISQKLGEIQLIAEKINVWRPLHAFKSIRNVKREQQKYVEIYTKIIDQIFKNLNEPVQGASGIDAGWLQTWSTSRGLAGLIRLQSTWSQVNELTDRKTAYSVACFSIYIALISLIVTSIFGVLSLL